MFGNLARKIFGSANDRMIKSLRHDVEVINGLEDMMSSLTDKELQQKTDEFRKQLASGKTEEDILHEAFAVVREASKRVLTMRHFDVQLIGGLVMHRGNIAEMKTGEGKTLVATLPVYLNAISGKGVHVVTVNDYLAKRDAEWMGKLYEFLGLSIGVIVHGLSDDERQQAYASDIVYGTNNEFGFDYLRDNMKFSLDQMCQRDFHYAIVDEVDSILIDEARTPLIISGPTETSTDLYYQVNAVIPKLQDGDFEKDEKFKNVTLTDQGVDRVEAILAEAGVIEPNTLYDISNVNIVHHVNQALRAHELFEKDKDYIVQNGHVVIIDEFTGRMMEGRRYSDGLHQAIEAKENVAVQLENQTLASITFQNYFRLYPKLAGMTGTAMTEEAEFSEIYKLSVVEIPTNKPCVRNDENDEIYKSSKEKYNAIIELVKDCHQRKQPVLIGTVSIENSELLSKLLKKNKLPHNVLNARYHEKEAQIIALAGEPGAITIATNMAGRGTDIQLGGNFDMLISELKSSDNPEKQAKDLRAEINKKKQKLLKAGGLYIIGTERHESRRIDNQLRGRSGRQGDAGASKFFLSLDDDLMRIFGSERMNSILERLGIEEGEAIVHPWITKAIEKAQQKVEVRNFDIRKQLLKFDNVMNDQRKVVYEQRKALMSADSVKETINDFYEDILEEIVAYAMPEGSYSEQWDLTHLTEECQRLFNLDLPISDWAAEEGVANEEIKERIANHIDTLLKDKEKKYSAELMRVAEKQVMLHILDQQWKDHLLSMDHLRQGIHLRAHAQRDPLNEYKREAFELFESMLQTYKETILSLISRMELHSDPSEMPQKRPQKVQTNKAKPDNILKNSEIDPNNPPPGWVFHKELARWLDPNAPETWGKISRNAQCPCGSGKKYKFCHGQI